MVLSVIVSTMSAMSNEGGAAVKGRAQSLTSADVQGHACVGVCLDSSFVICKKASKGKKAGNCLDILAFWNLKQQEV